MSQSTLNTIFAPARLKPSISRPLVAAALLLMVLTVAHVQAQQTNTLETYKTALQRQEQTLLTQYSNTLESLMTSYTQKGDLDAVLIVETEIKRFNEAKTVLAPAASKEVFRTAVETYNKASVDLLKKYVVALDGLVKKLVVAGNIEEAKEAKMEKERAALQLETATAMLPNIRLVNLAKGAKVDSNRDACEIEACYNVVDGNTYTGRKKGGDFRNTEGICSPQDFNETTYLKFNPDVLRKYQGSAWEHYLKFGQFEDRPGAGTNFVSYWFSGEGMPKPDWIRLMFKAPAKVWYVRILVPKGVARFPRGHEPLNYDVIGLNGDEKTTLASVTNGQHPTTEAGLTPEVCWIVVKLQNPKVFEGVQFVVKRTSSAKKAPEQFGKHLQLTAKSPTAGSVGPIVFEIEVLGEE